VVEVNGVHCGINICADVWEPGAADAARGAGAELLLALNASPYHMNKQATRYEVLRERIAATGLPVLYANLVGGQDELVFDGASFALDGEGRLAHQLPQFAEALEVVDYADGALRAGAVRPRVRPLEAEVYDALVLGVRDYLGKNGFPGAIIGLSGGIDSALTLAVAVDALGADRVRAVMMPSPYTAQISLDDAREMARGLACATTSSPSRRRCRPSRRCWRRSLPACAADTTEENLQARIRGMILMALSNKYGSIVLTTGNKSEMAVGYATLYGDMAGGFRGDQGPLQDPGLSRLCALPQRAIGPVIPERIITRAPSAELKPDQTDQDTLPPYEVLDAIIEAYMERDLSPREIVALGLRGRRRAAHGRHAQAQRIQAAPGAHRHPRDEARFWQGLALSDNIGLCRRDPPW
jgi:NAD+ synthase (glutamine-hydrolysing)